MVNTDDFIKRLEFLMDNYSLNASAFADKIGVQRSSISHLLSGRNNPSLDFVLKIQEFFPEVNLYWILNGKEKFLKSDQKENFSAATKPLIHPSLFANATSENIENNQIEKAQSDIVDKILVEEKFAVNDNNFEDNIFKIVIFYSDGSFNDFIQG